MNAFRPWYCRRPAGAPTILLALLAASVLTACGGKGGDTGSSAASGASGGTGSVANSGPARTSLRVEASDADGDTLQYQWRVTGGSVENRNARETVWTLPDGPGLHFAYVVISDGKGGYIEQQYAVSSDNTGIAAPARQPVTYTASAVNDFSGTPARLRFASSDKTLFATPGGGAQAERRVYLPDVQVQVQVAGNGPVVFSGTSDLSGEVSLPKLDNNKLYDIKCATTQGDALAPCASGFGFGTVASVAQVSPALTPGRNLRLYGHVALSDGAICGMRNEFFGMQSAATVQLLQADGAAAGAPVRVNRFGDYAVDAAVAVQARLKLRVQCESYTATLDVPAPAARGYASDAPLELSHQIPNSRPQVVKLLANGQDGNVRGQMVELELPGAQSKALPNPDHFLTYKGKDTRLSACMYYRSIGAAGDCDAQGNMIRPVSFDDWKRRHQFKPFAGSNTEVAATYINRWDLNLVRRMVATSTAPDSIAFYVCNHPGPDGTTQIEIDQVLDTARRQENMVACVAMEWSTSPGVNDGLPFTKFLTFAPDGALLPSINLDGRGEKYMPGACVACHGGTKYNGRFPDAGNPSPLLGARFLPFDTANYLFSARPELTEQAQTDALYLLNKMVRLTEKTRADAPEPPQEQRTSTMKLIDGWYPDGKTPLDKNFVPEQWRAAETQAATAGAARFYREVIATSCRTCHTALGGRFDWDAAGPLLLRTVGEGHACGGTADLAKNASMPNALVTRNNMSERIRVDPGLAALMRTFLGCDAPRPDPAYPQR
jgi:mono/diheme cytochrome c family protein